jgi:hypothetical protein
VETGNSWQSRKNIDMNEAVLDGMVAALPSGQTGVYSTHYQWTTITGTLDSYSQGALGSLPQWIPTGTPLPGTSSEAANCKSYPKVTSGPLVYMQYSGTYNGTSYDYDYTC